MTQVPSQSLGFPEATRTLHWFQVRMLQGQRRYCSTAVSSGLLQRHDPGWRLASTPLLHGPDLRDLRCHGGAITKEPLPPPTFVLSSLSPTDQKTG